MKTVGRLFDLFGRVAVLTDSVGVFGKSIALAFDDAGINNSKFRFQT